MINYQLSIYLIIVTVLISSCKIEIFGGNDESTFTGPSWSLGFGDEDNYKEFLKMLNEENIPYRSEGRKSIQVPVNFIAKTRAIKRNILHGEKLEPYTFEVIIVNNVTQKKYELSFKEQNIPFTLKNIHGAEEGWKSMHYSQLYGPQVDQIKQRLMVEDSW